MLGNVTQIKLENLKEKENLEDLGEDGRIVVSNEKTGHILDSSNSIGVQAESYFEHGKKFNFP
jgi:hypothetical protein